MGKIRQIKQEPSPGASAPMVPSHEVAARTHPQGQRPSPAQPVLLGEEEVGAQRGSATKPGKQRFWAREDEGDAAMRGSALRLGRVALAWSWSWSEPHAERQPHGPPTVAPLPSRWAGSGCASHLALLPVTSADRRTVTSLLQQRLHPLLLGTPHPLDVTLNLVRAHGGPPHLLLPLQQGPRSPAHSSSSCSSVLPQVPAHSAPFRRKSRF